MFMDERMSGDIENLLDEKLKPIKNDINSLISEINNIKNLLESRSGETFEFDNDYGSRDIAFNRKYSGIDVETIWSEAKQLIKAELTEVSYNTWIDPIAPIKLEKDTIYLETSSLFPRDIVNRRYSGLIKTAISSVTSQNYDVKIDAANSVINEERNISSKPKDNEFKSVFDTKYAFSSFIMGKFNRLTCESAKYMAEDISRSIKLLYIYGGRGMGKTHLLNAIGHYIYTYNPGKKVVYLTIDDFVNQMIDSIRRDKQGEFFNKFKDADLIMIDDLQHISDKERTQEEFHRVISGLLEMDKQVIISCTEPPEQINIQNDCFSRVFEMGGVFEIGKPDFDDRLLILEKRADEKNIEISNEILELIAKNEDYNVRELINILNRLRAYINITGGPITVGLVEDIISEGFFREKD